MEVKACLSQLGPIKAETFDWDEVENNLFFFPDASKLEALDEYMRDLKSSDSVGAKVKVVASNVPVGLGEPVFDRLDAELAHSLMVLTRLKALKLVMALMWLSKKALSIATS
ncbi:chorismate synthase [Pseudoalteromonas sp. B193]